MNDGRESNSRYLRTRYGWRGVGFDEVWENSNINLVRARIQPDILESLLDALGTPVDLDLLSIDVDGEDIWILSSLQRYRPRVIVIEYCSLYNSTDIIVHNETSSQKPEASILAIYQVAYAKGYELVHLNGVNAFFVLRTVLQAAALRARFVGAGDLGLLCTRPRSPYSWHSLWTSPGRCGITRSYDDENVRISGWDQTYTPKP